ncbi:phytoene desaturase family protein [Glycomyces buryatensis]|uniref:Pyridine nucleotide-disulfide oxidoreductase domain-containing protein 2 n=1 Tax=Glycomyces buryatensis TaxID=2570927 RepID=A0A4V4HSH1_9ACTN|nr:NAD(P)/FAD-dependent oxidoreductase [Glycomyces buryatensis]THV41676.1 NAD(P)/FAD-dependent oxidoreductase [Glycomyces buryatensis]
MPLHKSYDVVIVGGGHNGLVSAAYLARAGKSVLILERLGHTGGAAVSAPAFPGVDAQLSRYSYLVSLLPRKIIDDLGLRFQVRKRDVCSYTPTERGGRATGLLVGRDGRRTRESFARLTGSDAEFDAWREFYASAEYLAEKVFPTLTEPLASKAELRRRIGDDRVWTRFFERPLGETIENVFTDDLVRGVVLTDGLIGTFTSAWSEDLRQNRCFLYHVIGGGTGDWDVPVGGMGALTDELAAAARSAGAEILTGHEVSAIATAGSRAEVSYSAGPDAGTVETRHVLVNASPEALAALLGQSGPARAEGAQLKVNMLLKRLPRLRDSGVDPRDAFSGTFHVSESFEQLESAYAEAASGKLPSRPPSEIYCHTLTDPSILGDDLVRRGYQTLTLFGLHAPARLFEGGEAANREARARLLDATIEQLEVYLDEPLADCLATDGNGDPCIEAKTPVDLENDLRLPGGNIFHRDLSWPFRTDEASGRWGVETGHANVFLCGAGAVRGGGVSGIPGHNAAMAVLEARS